MAFNFKSFSDIYNDIVGSLRAQNSKLTDMNQGSRLYGLTRAFTSSLSLGWIGLAELKSLFFVQSSFGEDLDKKIADFGMTRNPGSYATGSILVYPDVAGKSVTLGDRISNADGNILFDVLTTTEIEFPYTSVPVVAASVGAEYNLPAGTTLFGLGGGLESMTLIVASNGLDVEGNPTGAISGGVSKESDDEVKARFIDYLKSLARGTRIAIEQALKGTPGVGSVIVEEAKPVPGWITVTVSDTFGELPITLQTAIEQTLTDWGVAGMGYVIQPIARKEFSITVTVYVNDQTLNRNLIESAVADSINARFSSMQLGESARVGLMYKSAIPDSLTNAITNVVITEPTQDIPAEPNELLGLDRIQVNVIYA